MPRQAKEYSALDVKRLRHSGSQKRNVTFAVGGVSGLLLQITPNGGRSWLLRTTIGAKRREIGLGGFPDVTLAQARERAREAKDKVRSGIDPIAERKTSKTLLLKAQRLSLVFSDAVERYLATKTGAFKNEKHKAQWRSTLMTYANPVLGSMQVAEITVKDILLVLEPIWKTKTETASRLRGRIESVLSWATVAGHREGENPARWAGNLKELLPAPSKVAKRTNQPALQIDDAPYWYKQLRRLEGNGSRALEFVAITACRSKEVRGASWDEINFSAKMWIIPADRMKMGREHRVPLAPNALKLLKGLQKFEGNSLVFPAPRGGKLSDMTLSATMKRLHESDQKVGGAGFIDQVSRRRAVPHGLRSTFRDWVAERTDFSGDLAELALAHKVSNAVEAAYRRGDMIEKRRELMSAWERFLSGQRSSTATGLMALN